MENLQQLIYTYFEESKKTYTLEELRKKFKIKGEEQTNIFNSALKSLVENGSLFFDGKTYKVFTNELGVAHGEIHITKVGNGILYTEHGPIFIGEKNLNGALDGDTIIVHNIIKTRHHNNYIGEVKEVLKRRFGKVVYKVVGNGYDAKLVPNNENNNVDILINKSQLKNLQDGDYVSVDVSTKKRENKYIAEINRVIGNINTRNIEVRILFEEYNIPIDFPKEVEEEVKMLPTSVSEADIEGRVDLRNKEIITIDCDNTKDRDDACLVEKLPNGNYKIYVCISDVTHYIKPGSKSFEEALRRCNSHYVNNTCNPMFHPIISNGICSLSPNVDRLTDTVEMEIDLNGDVVDYKIYKSVINSKMAMKYGNVNKVLEGKKIDVYDRFTNQLKLMNELNDILEKARQDRNYIDFDIRDIEFIEDKHGEIVGFKRAEVGPAQLMIENFMVIANEVIDVHLSWLPFIHRIHEEPDQQSVIEILDLLRDAGYKIPKYKNIDAKTLRGILISLSKEDKLDIAKSMILKRMKRARYSTHNIGHYALQLSNYCHYTALIRRCTDFIIHTLIDNIDNLDYSEIGMRNLEKELQIICERASDMEKISEEIEEKGMHIQMAKHMLKHIGEEYDAYITEIFPHALLAKTEDMIVGKIKLEDMTDDKYYYDYEKNAVIGKNTKKKYKIGDKVFVVVKGANKETGIVTFKMNKQKVLIK